MLLSHGYAPCITLPSRVTNHSATLIDHIFTKDQDDQTVSGNIFTDFSDHFAIFTFRALSVEKKCALLGKKILKILLKY